MSKPGDGYLPGKVCKEPEFCAGGIRHRGSVNMIQAFARNVGTCALMIRERFKQKVSARI
jgi:hypothetical protein